MLPKDNDTPSANITDHVKHITKGLKGKSQPSKKDWWEKYLKYKMEFYGVPMADIRLVVKDWIQDCGLNQDNEPLLKETAWLLFEQSIAEQKLAAILILQNHLDSSLQVQDLHKLATLFQGGHIADWNTTDWLCVRVLGPAIEQHQNPNEIIKVFQEWVSPDTNPLWQKRAALVAFVNITQQYANVVLDIASRLVLTQERFAQTAIGWTLRNLSKTHPNRVVEFVVKHKPHLSSEAVNMTCAKLSNPHRKQVGLSTETKKRKRR